MALLVEAEPHFLSVDIGVQVPKPACHRFVVPQKAGVLPQFPFTEQQFPNVLPLQVAPLMFAPHFPSVEVGIDGCVVVVVVLELAVAELRVASADEQ